MRLVVGNILALAVLATAGCLPSEQAPAKADFRATDAAGRVPAIVDAAGRDDGQTLAELVHALSDDDPAVRLFAVQSLRERTGQRFGYRYYGQEDQRRAAAARWREWLTGQGTPAKAGVDQAP